MTFLHWSYDPDVVREHLSHGLDVDTWDGKAWVSLTPFLMADFRLGALPPAGRFSTFPETNLRTYVSGPKGVDGLWFLTLEADSLPTVLAASMAYGVPYRWSEMKVDDGATVRYRSHRRNGPAHHDIVVRPGKPLVSPSALDDWLTGRWRAYTTLAGRLAVASVEHEPWPLHHLEVLSVDESLFESVGLPAPSGEPLAHYSRGVSVKLGPPLLV